MHRQHLNSVLFLAVSLSGALFAQTAKPADNEKINAENAAIEKAFNDGNAAFSKKDYDGAIAIYDAAIKADPTHPGVTSLLVNKASAQLQRGIEIYNASIAAKDNGMRERGKQYFRDAADSSEKAVALAKSLNLTPQQLYPILVTRKGVMRFAATKAEPDRMDAAVAAYNDYLAVETDPAKKVQAHLEMGQMLIDSGQGAAAEHEYETVLASSPKNSDAVFGLGNSLFLIASEHDDKVALQKAANAFKTFLSLAPANDARRGDATMMLDNLKLMFGVVPK